MVSSDGGPTQGSDEHNEGDSEPHGLTADDHVVRGWLPPDQRAWRHPSEVGRPAASSRPLVADLRRHVPGGRRTAWATAMVGAGAVAALVSGGLMLASQSGPGPGSERTGSAAPPVAATRSIVRLEVSNSATSGYGCGIVVAPGGMIATDATLLAGAGRIVAMTSSGRKEAATVVAVDLASDVGLVKVSASLPVARVVDWGDLQPGADAVELAVETRTQGDPTSAWWSETIASSGLPVSSGPGQGMASVVATTPRGNPPAGAVLMEPDGAVVGLLDHSGESGGGGAVFLPGQFVVSVARELMSDDGKIQHGWLGIKGGDSTAGTPKGALVTSVDPDGAAAGHLDPGDVIEAVDGHRVRSMADLRSRLYLLAPGTWVDLRVDRHHSVENVDLALLATS